MSFTRLTPYETATSFNASQNSSSNAMLVWRPLSLIECFNAVSPQCGTIADHGSRSVKLPVKRGPFLFLLSSSVLRQRRKHARGDPLNLTTWKQVIWLRSESDVRTKCGRLMI